MNRHINIAHPSITSVPHPIRHRTLREGKSKLLIHNEASLFPFGHLYEPLRFVQVISQGLGNKGMQPGLQAKPNLLSMKFRRRRDHGSVGSHSRQRFLKASKAGHFLPFTLIKHSRIFPSALLTRRLDVHLFKRQFT